ncbi:carbohydrate ABC transporter permease [Anaerotalea alkaliphila]|uniref:Carbohydrate ABC transporter permease n=1 Tax=Anaerotalea alkaliphila TaxID=2662126 RepID=A0A7X5KPN0_9FIRM|nr:carbohydrate ABC transporter permease [Anaerotalea alkaliphila]NDL68402.1 carbohydrate ABC transporter permease [Anaerotalea alkaliphila]
MNPVLKRQLFKAGIYLASLVILVITGFPFVFLLINSFKDMPEYLSNIWMLPQKLYVGNYGRVLQPSFLRYFLNSVIVGAGSVFIIVAVSSMISFSFAKMQYRFKNVLYFLIIAGMMIPVHTTLIPTFTLLSGIGLNDSLVGLMGPYVSYNIPISVFILTQFFKEIPKEIEESAIIDGCGPVGIFLRMILPLSGPAISTVVVYTFLSIWNEFINANVLITTTAKKTLPLGIREFYGFQTVNIPAVLTAILVGSLPVILVYFFAQEKVLNGLTQGAVKG